MSHRSAATIISHIYSNPLVDCASDNGTYSTDSAAADSGLTPIPLLDHHAEVSLLRDVVGHCQDKVPVELYSVPATTENFQSCFARSKILHFCGE